MGAVPGAAANRCESDATVVRAALLGAGLTEDAIARAGVIAHDGDGGAGLLLPVPGPDGSRVTARLFPAAAPLASQPMDVGPFGRGESAALEGLRTGERYIAVPFVAPGSAPHTHTAILASHDLWALGIAERTGLPTVSTFGDRLIEAAVRRAAELAEGGCLIVAAALGPRFTARQLRRIVALAGIDCREVRVAFWAGAGLSAVPHSALDDTWRLTHDHRTRSCATPGLATLFRLEGPEAVMAELAGGASRLALGAAVRWATRHPQRLAPLENALDRYAGVVQEIARDAAEQGARVGIFGGVAIDLIAGGTVRPRKDLDLLVTGGPPDILQRLSLPLEARGYRRLFCRPGEQVVLQSAEATLDLYRLVPDGPEGVTLSTRFTVQHFAAAPSFIPWRVGEHEVPLLDPLLVAAMKAAKLAEMSRPYLRSGWLRTGQDRADLAALRARVDFAQVAALEERGSWWAAPLTPFRFRRTAPGA